MRGLRAPSLLAEESASRPATGARRAEILLPIATAIWLLLVGAGLGFLMSYANRPGDQGTASRTWSANDLITPSVSQPTLLVFAHPRCPCTIATMGELDRLLTRCRNHVECHVVFFQAEGEDENWCKTDCWQAASAIPGVEIDFDPESKLASEFGVLTSGHVLLYDTDGSLMFEGGITPSRGHRGDNPGRSRIVSLVLDDDARTSTDTPLDRADTKDEDGLRSTCVFGCPLHSPDVASRPLVNEGP